MLTKIKYGKILEETTHTRKGEIVAEDSGAMLGWLVCVQSRFDEWSMVYIKMLSGCTFGYKHFVLERQDVLLKKILAEAKLTI